MSVEALSEAWILDLETDSSPIGRFSEFEYMYAPNSIAKNLSDGNKMSGSWTNCGPTADAACTMTCFCTTLCGPLTTASVCGC